MAERRGDKKSDHVLGDSDGRGTRKRLEPRAGYWIPGERCRKRGTQRHKLTWKWWMKKREKSVLQQEAGKK